MNYACQQILLLRVFTVGFGLIAVYWGASELSAFRNDKWIEKIATRIIAGDPFKAETLRNQARFLEQIEKLNVCRPSALRSAALVRLRIAETFEDSSRNPADIRAALTSIRGSLACSPDDPFFWVVLFGAETPGPLSYLRESYRLGPNEGWIALKRNPLAFAKFDHLPEDVRGTVLREFLGILEPGLYDEAYKILTGPAWGQKDLIWSQLGRISPRHRQAMAARLAADGYDVPGANLGSPIRGR
jgi:hypothetical protein